MDQEKDRIFGERKEAVSDFKFDEKTAEVFEDMLDRSVPFYGEIQRMIIEMTRSFAQEGTVYDLGCSVGTTLALLAKELPPACRFVGVDLSGPMLERARAKLAATGALDRCELVEADLAELERLEDASVVIMCLTLQFVRPLHRDALLKAIYDSLGPKGCLILVEKVLGNDSLFNRLFIKLYYDFKRRQGYSELEIAQKREALESVLIPYRIDENVALLRRVGFESVEVFFKWYNFAGLIAVKQ